MNAHGTFISILFGALFTCLLLNGCGENDIVYTPVPPAGRLEVVTFPSDILDEERTILVYLPDGYDPNRDEPYPVVYLLHEFDGDAYWWRDWMNIDRVMDELIHDGRIVPLIVAMPDGGNELGGSFFTGSYDELHRPALEGAHGEIFPLFDVACRNDIDWGTPVFPDYEVHLVEEVRVEIDTRYNTVESSRGRAIHGVGMGGYGALMTALAHPDIFGSVACHGGYLAFLGTSYREIRPALTPSEGGSAGLFDIVPDLIDAYQPAADGRIVLHPFEDEHPYTKLFFALGAVFSPNIQTPEYVLDEGSGVGCDLPIAGGFLLDSDGDGIVEAMEDTNGNGVVDGLEDLNGDGLLDGIAWHVWQRWLKHDPTYLIYRNVDIYSPLLETLNLYFDCGEDERHFLNRQSTVFINLLVQVLGFTEGEDFHFNRFPGGHLDYLHQAIDDAFISHSRFFEGD